MTAPTRLLALAALSVLLLAPAARGADLDRSAVDFKTPAEIKWVRNAPGTNESAVRREEVVSGRGARLPARRPPGSPR